MANKLGNIVLYADNPMGLAEFWAAVFGYEALRAKVRVTRLPRTLRYLPRSQLPG
ncbi:hypothetical protein [Demequina aurantiaca]|uniref:hypothetical protein n=1 Tax=Demequina aurantiaca TaxID=676200 RepID=UPI003D3467CE